MLGGSFYIAFFRNSISVGLLLTFFLMLDRPRCSMKKAIGIYVVFGVLMIGGYSLWYHFFTASFVQFASLSSFLTIGVFCGIMSSEILYLSVYKMAVGFYMFSVAPSVVWMWPGGGLREISGWTSLRALFARY